MRHRINRLTREKILGSEEFKNMASHTYRDIVKGLEGLESIGGLVRGVPHRFLCLVQKMESIALREEAAADTLEELVPADSADISYSRFRGNVCLIAGLLLYLRLSEDPGRHGALIRRFLQDFRKIPLVDEQNTRSFVYLDAFADDLLNRHRMLNVHLSKADL